METACSVRGGSVWADLVVCMPDYSVGSLVWALYSYIPPALILGVLVWFCVQRTTTALFAVIFGLFTVALNELLLKRISPQPRPSLALGMPSGHSMVALEFLVWLMLELLFPRRRVVAPRRTVAAIFWAVVLLLPVPVSRVMLHYHTVGQVLTGGFLGAVFGLLWFVLLAMVAAPRRWLDRVFSRRSRTLRHTYRLSHDGATSPRTASWR